MRLGMGANCNTLWGDRMRADRKVGPRRSAAQAAAARGARSHGGGSAVGEGDRPGTISARSRGRRRGESSGRRLRRLLEPGCSAAPERHCLALLPSGSDAVRRLPVRGTWLSTLRAPAQAPEEPAPRAAFGPARADVGFREPLAPRLARPGRTMVSDRRTLSSPGRVAQRESARLTRERSLVQVQYRPPSRGCVFEVGTNSS